MLVSISFCFLWNFSLSFCQLSLSNVSFFSPFFSFLFFSSLTCWIILFTIIPTHLYNINSSNNFILLSSLFDNSYYLIWSYFILNISIPCHVFSCLVFSCLVFSCLVMSSLVLSSISHYLFFPYLFFLSHTHSSASWLLHQHERNLRDLGSIITFRKRYSPSNSPKWWQNI